MSVLFFMLTQPEAEGQIQEIARTFGIDWPHLTAQTISFCLVCALLYALAYRPILRMLDARRQQIAQGLANAEKIEAELALTRANRQHVLEQAHTEAAQLVEDGRAAAARIRALETQKAVKAAEQILAGAHDAAERDRVRMRGELRREVGRLVVQTTSAVSGKVLTPEDQQRLAQDVTRQLAS